MWVSGHTHHLRLLILKFSEVQKGSKQQDQEWLKGRSESQDMKEPRIA